MRRVYRGVRSVVPGTASGEFRLGPVAFLSQGMDLVSQGVDRALLYLARPGVPASPGGRRCLRPKKTVQDERKKADAKKLDDPNLASFAGLSQRSRLEHSPKLRIPFSLEASVELLRFFPIAHRSAPHHDQFPHRYQATAFRQPPLDGHPIRWGGGARCGESAV